VVIEHNLDVIRASDWLIDLGPEGGDAGGLIVAQGTPEEVRLHATSHTGQALREYDRALGMGSHRAEEGVPLQLIARARRQATVADNAIQIINAREHNLKSLSVNIPRGQFSVVTGVSGSGKSTLAFDILFNEGQRRYLESLNAYARSIVQPAGRPEVDAVYGIPPTVAIEQRLSRGGRKSTVGTTTEVWHFLRLLFVKLGVQHCIHDGAAVQPQTPERIAAQLMTQFRGQHIGLLAPLVMNRKGVYTELADWARPRGYTHLRVDGNFLPTTGFPRIDRFKEHTIELPVLSLDIKPENETLLRDALARALEHGKGVVHVLSDLAGLREAMHGGRAHGRHRHGCWPFPRCAPARCAAPATPSSTRACSPTTANTAGAPTVWAPASSSPKSSARCSTTRCATTTTTRPRADLCRARSRRRHRHRLPDLPGHAAERDGDAAVQFGDGVVPGAAGIGITDLARLAVTDIRQWVDTLALTGRDREIARDLVPEIKSRLEFLEEVGLGYLTLDRGAPTLSGGEAQRIRLAAQLGSNLQGVCYVLDEPTIGLHARDNRILLNALKTLSDKGNTLVVVEHDEDTIRRADHIIDIGPSAGKRGGRLVAEGTVKDITGASDSQTGRYLLHAMKHPLQARRPVTEIAPESEAIKDQSTLETLAKKTRKMTQFAGWPCTGPTCTTCKTSAPPSRSSAWSPSPACPVPASPRSRATCCWPACRRW
jgi:excinuclease ABC subunit A